MGTTTAGRPRTFDEGEVLDRAVSLFWRRGYRTTTTRHLEAALQIRQSSLYNAFGSKRALFSAALDRYESMTAATLLEPLETSAEGLGSIHRFFDDLASWVTADGRGGCMIINLMAEDGAESDEITARTAAYRARVRASLTIALRRASALNETSATALETRADVLFGSVLGINIAARGGAAADELHALLAATHYLVDSWRTEATT
jgi:AcrR family transcriptional regulator